MKYSSAGFLPLGLVTLLAFAVPSPVSADPWKDESGKGRKHHEWKGRGKDRDKAFEKARKRLEQHDGERRKRAERRRERQEHGDGQRAWTGRTAIGRVELEARRPAVTDRRRVPPTAEGPRVRPATTRAARVPTATIDRRGTAGTATDARRRAAVASYLQRHPAG